MTAKQGLWDNAPLTEHAYRYEIGDVTWTAYIGRMGRFYVIARVDVEGYPSTDRPPGRWELLVDAKVAAERIARDVIAGTPRA